MPISTSPTRTRRAKTAGEADPYRALALAIIERAAHEWRIKGEADALIFLLTDAPGWFSEDIQLPEDWELAVLRMPGGKRTRILQAEVCCV